jgi:hypothetical protein
MRHECVRNGFVLTACSRTHDGQGSICEIYDSAENVCVRLCGIYNIGTHFSGVHKILVPSELQHSIQFLFFPVPVCAITASGVPGGTFVSMNRFSTLCG